MEFNALSGILMFHCCQRSRKVASATNRKALPFDFAILLLSNLFNILKHFRYRKNTYAASNAQDRDVQGGPNFLSSQHVNLKSIKNT